MDFKGKIKEGGHWNPYFFGLLNDWKMDNVKDLFSNVARSGGR